jgi:membrane protein implicated in regulation of membrane protease activity
VAGSPEVSAKCRIVCAWVHALPFTAGPTEAETAEAAFFRPVFFLAAFFTNSLTPIAWKTDILHFSPLIVQLVAGRQDRCLRSKSYSKAPKRPIGRS